MKRSVLVEQAAELLGVSRRTVYYRIREGRLHTLRTRCGSQRVLMESIERLLREERDARERKARAKKRPRRDDAPGASEADGGEAASSDAGSDAGSDTLQP